MALKVVQDTSTNWTAAEWREIEALKKILADSDNRSGRPWLVGAKVNNLAPLLDGRLAGGGQRRRTIGGTGGSAPSRDPQRVRDLALEVGETSKYLMNRGFVDLAWPPASRVPKVNYSVFQVLAAAPNREQLLANLLKEKEPFDISKDDAKRAMGYAYITTPATSTERLAAFYTVLDRFPKRLRTQTDINLAKQIINRLEILIGEAEEEAV